MREVIITSTLEGFENQFETRETNFRGVLLAQVK